MSNKYITTPTVKLDAMQLLTGAPVYTEDLAPKDCLIVKLIRSPHAFARVKSIEREKAAALDGIEIIITHEDVPNSRFTCAGQSYPEPSPYDRRILDEYVRFVGDPVVIVAGTNEEVIEKAIRMIKIEYEVLEPILDFRKSKDNPILIHPEDNWVSHAPFFNSDNKRNLCATGKDETPGVDEIFANADVVIEKTYHTKACQQAHMETVRAYTKIDTYGRLEVLSSTQIPFHVRRILGHALEIPKSKIRVIKPRIGGGFGAKQTAICEMYPAVVTWMTKKPAMIIYTRRENQIASSPRHEMEVTVKLAGTKDGKIEAVDIFTLSNTGAYGEHGPTTVGLSGHKSLPLYQMKAYRFNFDVVYTNYMSSGAYRGYGATQGIFALESTIDEFAHKVNMDPIALRLENVVSEGMVMPAYYNELLKSCRLDKCLEKAAVMAGWKPGQLRQEMPNGKIRSLGCALAMQGSGISRIDQGAVRIKLNDDGYYALSIGATDMGTGCDTILSQMLAEVMDCPMENIFVSMVDTDTSPYDTGSYASSTTYITGMAVVKAAEELKEKLKRAGAKSLELSEDEVEFGGDRVYSLADESKFISLKDIANTNMVGNQEVLTCEASHSSPTSPPPFMAGIVLIELDPMTGEVELLDFYAVVDCGTIINTNLARVQTEGGLAQGIGMALYEEVYRGKQGRNYANSFMQYKIPNRVDVGKLHVDFESSYEPTGPFGAKSIGEIVINTPSPAIANAVYNAVGVRVQELPITPEKILKGLGKI